MIISKLAAVLFLIIATGCAHASPLPRADEAGKHLARLSEIQANPASGTIVLRPFDYQGVTLDGWRMRSQFDEVKNYYLAIPNDNLLKGFRARAGFPAPGGHMGGWYSADVFHVFGQIISGLSRMYGASGDAACKQKVQFLLAEWAKCIEADGYFFYSRNPNASHYIYDKMVGGLVDAYQYADIGEALDYLDRITTWAEKNLDRSNLNVAAGPGEWYTLSENLYRAYLCTGNPRYRDFGKVWEYTKYWDAYANGTDIFSLLNAFQGYHAYSHVNTLSGAAMAYWISGEGRYLDTIRNAHDYLRENQAWATGGYGPTEMLLRPNQTANALNILDLWANHFETQCGSWSIFKLCKYLMASTGEARYGDWIEEAFWNGIGASIPMSAAGEVQYYSHYHLGGAKKSNNMGPWTCCTGTRPQAVGDYADLIYFTDADGLYVNLFTDSTARWNQGGAAVEVVQRTRMPEEQATSFTVILNHPTTFSLALRTPKWLDGPIVFRVNGQVAAASQRSKGWAVLRRKWNTGDRVQVSLPMGFALNRFPAAGAKSFPAAITYGPVVMALKAADRNPQALIRFDNLASNFIAVAGEPLKFQLAADAGITAKPYYAFGADEKYFMYFDPAYKWVHVNHLEMSFPGGWAQNVDFHYSNTVGNYVAHSFEGTAVRLRYQKFDDAAYAGIFIDGNQVAEIDQYNSWRGARAEYTISNLSPGHHTIRIAILAKRNPASKNGYVNVMGIDYMPVRVNKADSELWQELR